jgi:plastocyanin
VIIIFFMNRAILIVVMLVLVGVGCTDKQPSTDIDNSMISDNSDVLRDVVDISDGDMTTTESHIFDITGKNFEFSEKEIRVKSGDTVTINFKSESGFHDWKVDELDVATEVVSGESSSSVTFVADKVGSFEYYCSVGSHRANGMIGRLIVE